MKPSFALSLSFDGIRLLHRAAGGWRSVGDVSLDSTDMAGELAILRRTASALEPGGLHTKVLLPNEQIKYLTIDTAGQDDAARRAAAEVALHGATPYAVADLAFDISTEGDQTHIAAVARETLAEAESFAIDHRFNPISWAAIPGDNAYLGEPFFGVTPAAADVLEPGETVEQDGIAVVVIGSIVAPDGPVAARPETKVPEPEPVEAPTPEQATLEVTQVTRTAAPQAERDPETTAAKKAPQEQAPAALQAETEPATDPTSEGSSEPEAARIVEQEPAPSAVGFASRRNAEQGSAPQLGGVSRSDAPAQGAVIAAHLDIEPDVIPEPIPVIAVPAEDPVPAPIAEPAARSSFLSRRKTEKPPPSTAQPAGTAAITEEDRMTVFGNRRSNVGGKPRFLGLILTAALLVFLAGVAAWASVFLDDGMALSRLFGDRAPKTEVASVDTDMAAPAPSESPAIALPQGVIPEDPAPQIRTASLDPSLSSEDAAVLDALSEPAIPQAPAPVSDAELSAIYAVTGIWSRGPQVPSEPASLINIDDLYLTSIDPVSTATDAVALPGMSAFDTDVAVASVSSPAAAGTLFTLDATGLVVPTAQGALSPDGFTVFLGQPPLVPPATPARFQAEPEDTQLRSAIADLRPQPRPADLVEQTERAQLDGLTRSELAGLRPALRPPSLQQQAEEAAAPEPKPAPDAEPIITDGAVAIALAPVNRIENATKQAVRASVRPDVRPRNFSRIVRRAERAKPKDPVRVASAAGIAPRAVKPKIPSKASVARQATVKNAINLRNVNLIGVYGKPSSRRALVRLSNGRYKKVVVGDRIDGGKVSAIGESELRYVKRGRNLTLKMPR